MNIKTVTMIMCAIAFSSVGFASSTPPSSSSVRKTLFSSPNVPSPKGSVKSQPSKNIEVSTLDRPGPGHDLIEEKYRDEGREETRMITDPEKYGKNIPTNQYVYQARNDVIDVLQKNITGLEEQAIALEEKLKALQAEDAEYVRAVEIKKQALKDALLG